MRAVSAVPVPMNHRLTADEAAYIFDNSDAVLAFVGDAFLPVVEAVRARAPRVRHWVLFGGESRPWASPLDDLVAAGRPDPVEVGAGENLGGSNDLHGGNNRQAERGAAAHAQCQERDPRPELVRQERSRRS
jgi:acyl-CoA synthetase (AMP-forming)/AMP-acid ligase II